MATSAEIRNKAAKKLGLYGTGQTLRSAIATDIDAAYTEVYGRLQSLQLTTWGAAQEVPASLVEPVVALVANARVNEYSVPLERYQRIKADALDAMGMIREIVYTPKVGVTEIDNF